MLPQSLKRFIQLFSQIPGIGPRQAQRIAFWFLGRGKGFLYSYSLGLKQMADKIKICSQCFFVFEQDSLISPGTNADLSKPKTDKGRNSEGLCQICRDDKRDQTKICVVEKETDLISLEKTKTYTGLYHVLGGLLGQSKNIPPLRLEQLKTRIKNNPQTKEIILALSHTAQGDLTAMELQKTLSSKTIKVTRLGLGLPRGAEVEFADEETLTNALDARR